jgi:predicted nucleotidyltransferase component of viral defense system
MIQLEQIKNFYPPLLRDNADSCKHILKEYIQLMVLNFLSSSVYVRKLTFIGGTNLRLIRGIDRFSEDLDFDCKDFSKQEFMEMTDDVIRFLNRSGLNVEPRDRDNERLTAYRRSIYFPELLFDMDLSGHREERFLLKIEMQNQEIDYRPTVANIQGCGFFFPIPVPSAGVLCSMKIAAMLARAKGRDFYDLMFLLSQTQPDYVFLEKRCGIHNLHELQEATARLLKVTDLNIKKRDFEHLLFSKTNSEKILHFGKFMQSLK